MAMRFPDMPDIFPVGGGGGGGGGGENLRGEILRKARGLGEGFSSAEFQQAMRVIMEGMQGQKAKLASMMTRFGGSLDPSAWMRGQSNIAAGLPSAIGGLHAESARVAREGKLAGLQIMSGVRGQDIQAREARKRREAGEGGFGEFLTSLIPSVQFQVGG